MENMIKRLNEEGLAWSMGSSPHESNKPIHTVYAHVAATYYKLHCGTANEFGNGYANPGSEAAALQMAYDDYRSRNPI